MLINTVEWCTLYLGNFRHNQDTLELSNVFDLRNYSNDKPDKIVRAGKIEPFHASNFVISGDDRNCLFSSGGCVGFFSLIFLL